MLPERILRHRAEVKSLPGAPLNTASPARDQSAICNRKSKRPVPFGLQPETVYRPVSAGMKRGVQHFSV